MSQFVYTPSGAMVSAQAKLIVVEGQRVRFPVAHDDGARVLPRGIGVCVVRMRCSSSSIWIVF